MKFLKIGVQNSLLYFRDAKIYQDPEILAGAHYWLTPSCIAICCQPDSEGETEIALGSVEEAKRREKPLLDVILSTPTGRIVLETVRSQLAKIEVPGSETRVRVWTDAHRATQLFYSEWAKAGGSRWAQYN